MWIFMYPRRVFYHIFNDLLSSSLLAQKHSHDVSLFFFFDRTFL